MKLEEAVHRFISHLTYEKKQSAHTITAFKSDLEQFSTFLASGSPEVSGIKHMMVRAWLAHLVGEGLSSRAAARKISTLRSFFKFMVKENELDASPIARIQVPKLKKRLPVFIEEEPMKKLSEELEFGDV